MFHVPESARLTKHPQLASSSADGNNGAFDVASVEPGWRLSIVCSDGTDDPELSKRLGFWEHVSIHAYKDGPLTGSWRGMRRTEIARTPTWREMCQAKDLFWGRGGRWSSSTTPKNRLT